MGTKGRGSLTSTANRDIIIKLVEEAVASGASQQKACEEMGISARTFQRWCNAGAHGADQRPLAKRPEPANFLTPHQRHSGQGEEILKKRHRLYEAAKARHPERWTRQTRNWTLPNEVWLNPEKSQDEDQIESKTDAS